MTGQRITSVPGQIARFYKANPDEELSLSDMQVKFRCSRQTIYRAMEELTKSGLLEHVSVVRLRAKGIAK